jgi:hypothetical protein
LTFDDRDGRRYLGPGARRVKTSHDAPRGLLHRILPFAMALALGACGARSGLNVPDGDIDASALPDGGLDGAVPLDPDAGVPCFEVPFEGETVEVPLQLEAELARADVLFLVDTTLSMEDEINAIRSSLQDRIAPQIAATIPDSALGVATFADFPEGDCGSRGDDTPFSLVQRITQDLNQVQAALDLIRLGNGLDKPESQVEALFQVATGRGMQGYVPPSAGCPSGGFGYPCFRQGALPVILLFTDAPFHNGPDGRNAYPCASEIALTSRDTPATYEDAEQELERIGASVIGLFSGDGEGRGDLLRVVEDTNESSTNPDDLLFDIGMRGERLTDSVVDAVETLADTIQFDVDTQLLDPDLSDSVDPRDFVERVVPIRAIPMDRIEGIDVEAGAFRGVRAGTLVFFALELFNDAVVPGPQPQRFLLEVVFRGDERTRLGSRVVQIVVPGADGAGCEALGDP